MDDGDELRPLATNLTDGWSRSDPIGVIEIRIGDLRRKRDLDLREGGDRKRVIYLFFQSR